MEGWILKKFKKILCIALCLIMSLQLLAFTASADSDLSEYTAEVNLLTALGITDGIHFESQADNLVTRAEFALLLTRLLNANVEKYSTSTVINDVTSAQYPYAAYLMDNGIMKGDGQGNFLPNDHVTVHQALVTVMRILGYDVVADAKGGTEGFYAEVASKLGLDAGIERYRDDRIQYKNVIRIFFNALHTGLYVQTVFGNEEKFATDIDRTLLYDRYEIKIAEGTVMASDVSAIDGSNVAADSIRIGNHVYEAPTIDAEKYLGYYVNAYYKEKGAIRELVYIDELEYSSSVTFDAMELAYNDFTYVCEDEDGKEREYDLSTDFTLVINGVFTVYDEDLMLPASGTVTLVNTNKDKKYETVVIRDERIEVVQLYNEKEEILSFKFGSEALNMADYDDDKVRIYNAKGRPTDTSALKEWAVVTILENDGYVSIYVSANSVKGTVSEINNENGVTTVTINDGTYIVSGVAKGDKVALGKSGSFYLDTNNRIITFREGTGIWTYAYVFDAAKETALDSVYKFEVFDNSCIKESKIYEAAPTIVVNGAKASAAGIDKKTGENLLARFEDTPTLVRYQANAKGQITEIQTAGTTGFVRLDPGRTDHTFDATKMSYFGRVMGKIFAISDTATIFVVPVNSDAQVDFTQKEKFIAGDYSYITANATTTTYYAMGFGENRDDFTSDFVIIGSTATTFTRENSTQGMVKKISKKLNEDGEAVDYIEIFTGSGTVKGAFIDPDITYTANIDDISELDIVQFTTSGDKLTDIKHQYDRSTLTVIDEANHVITWEGARKGWHTWITFPVYNVESGYIQYQTTFGNNNGKMVLPASSAKVVVCTNVNGNYTFRLGSLSDLKDIVHFGESSDVVTYMYDTINTLYIYN
jgi:hypothetical protein